MASIVGLSAAPNGVERKSPGKSVTIYNVRILYLFSKKKKRSTFDPRGYRSAGEKADAVICERVAIEVYPEVGFATPRHE